MPENIYTNDFLNEVTDWIAARIVAAQLERGRLAIRFC